MSKNSRSPTFTLTVPNVMTLTEETPSGGTTSSVKTFLEKLFHQQGWQVRSVPPLDLFLERGTQRYAVTLKVVREARRSELMGHLADAYLRARTASKDLDGEPLPIIGAPAISDKVARDLKAYAEQYLAGSAWGLIDGAGRLDFHGVQGAPVLDRSPEALAPTRAKERIDPFTDLGQWVLKVLLARRLAPELLTAPRIELRRTEDLAQAAAVSIPHAKRLLRFLRNGGFLREGRTIELVRVAELLALWAAASTTSGIRHRDLAARWLLPTGNSTAQLHQALQKHATTNRKAPSSKNETGARSADRWTEGSRACLGLFAAADRLGLSHVRGVTPFLYLEESSSERLGALGLTAAREGETPDVLIRVPRFPESCFRGLSLIDGVPTADILQCWLDVRSHPVRGEEQANLIFQQVLKPSLLES